MGVTIERSEVGSSDLMTASVALLHLVEVLRGRRVRAALIARWKNLVDRHAALTDAERGVFDRVLADLLPPLTRDDGELTDGVFGDLRAMARRVERTLDILTAREPETLPDEETLTVRYARVDLAALVRSCAAPFESVAFERGATFTSTVPTSLFADADPDKIEIALVSLLLNACEHVVRGGRVDCELEALGAFAELRVGDDGFRRKRRESEPGIPSVPARSPGSTGLGLGLARDVVALSGGALLVDAAGATFRVRIPLRAPAGVVVREWEPRASTRAAGAADLAREVNQSAAVTLRPTERSDRPLVLVAEDELHLHRLVVESLEPRYETMSAFDGVDALAQMTRNPPDLVILDLAMPEMDGEEVIREARARKDLADVPILVVSGAAETKQLVRLLETGAQDVLHKPFIVPELIARANNLIAAKRTRDLLNETIGRRKTDLVTLAEEVAQRQRELRETLAELDMARRAAEAAGRVKSNFLRMMSHELRTPITAMELQLRLLDRHVGAQLPPEAKEGIDRIARSSRRLCHLVDTVLIWARVESGRVQLDVSNVDLVAAARDACSEIEGYAAQKGVGVAVRAPAQNEPVLTDGKLIRLLLLNLISRAVQMTDSGDVEIEIRCGGWGGEVSIRDRGVPLSRDEHDALFSSLATVGDFHRHSGAGSGLDLHVVRDIALAVQGDVTIRNDHHVGNTLTLHLANLSQDQVTGTTFAGKIRDVRSG